MNEAKKRRFRFNILDVVILIILVACVLGIAVRYNVVDKINTKSTLQQAEIEFLIKDIKPTSAQAIKEGSAFYWTENGITLGKVKTGGITITPAEKFVTNIDGKWLKTTNEERNDVRVLLQAEGLMTDSGFMLSGTQYLAPGKEMLIGSSEISVNVTITDIKIVTNDNAVS